MRRTGVLQRIALVVWLTTVSACGVDEGPAGEWPRFRGPEGLGVSADADLPESWAPDAPNILWKTRIPGHGGSSPVVSGGRIFLTTTYGDEEDGREEVFERKRLQRIVLAVDQSSGEILWQTRLFGGPKGKIHHLNTHATPSPATDGKFVFVSFDGHLAALDFDGAIVWDREVESEYYRFSRYGAVSSPIVAGRYVVVSRDREDAVPDDVGWIAAFDRKTGEEMWRSEWADSCCSYASPLVTELGSRRLILNTTSRGTVAFDLETGERLWKVENGSIQPVPSPVLSGDLLVTPGGVHSRTLTVHRIGTAEDEATSLLWSTRKAVPEMSSPVLYEGRLFTVTDQGVMSAYAAETGDVIWRHRLDAGWAYRASLVAGEGKVYVVSDSGKTDIMRADTPKYRSLGVSDIGERALSSPAIAGGVLLLRGADHLFAIGKEASSERRRKPARERRAAAATEQEATGD